MATGRGGRREGAGRPKATPCKQVKLDAELYARIQEQAKAENMTARGWVEAACRERLEGTK